MRWLTPHSISRVEIPEVERCIRSSLSEHIHRADRIHPQSSFRSESGGDCYMHPENPPDWPQRLP
jgi:hypothetical protein